MDENFSIEKIYEQELTHWSELWDDSCDLFKNVLNIIQKSILLPNFEIQGKIAAVYLLQSSRLARTLPILFSWGERGSGKSTLAVLASKLRGINQIFSATDTFASIRNSLDLMRWHDPSVKSIEKEGAILCWDNLHAETLISDNKLYQMMLCGYSRATERLQIAGSDGFNREYRVFCPKIISSIDPLHQRFQFAELERRLIVLIHKPVEKFKTSDVPNNSSIDELKTNFFEEKIDIDGIAWNGIEELFLKPWTDENICLQYVRLRKQLTKPGKKSIKLPENIEASKFTCLIDLLITGLILGAWESPQEGLEVFSSHFAWLENQSETLAGYNLKRLIENEFLSRAFPEVWHEMNESLRDQGLEPAVKRFSTKALKQFIEEKKNNGSVDIILNPDILREIMRSLGFKLQGNYWVEI